jgi:transposase
VVLCVDEKSQIQALDRTQPQLPIRPGLPARRTHDYKRNGTTTLFAALEVATGKVIDACYPRHRHQEFLKFLKQVAKAYPRRQLHIVLDNYGTHKHPKVNAWLERNPRVHLHFTPTSGSWLNMVETFFSIITRQAIRRGTFPSVPDLIAAIRRYIAGKRTLRTVRMDQRRRHDPCPREPSKRPCYRTRRSSPPNLPEGPRPMPSGCPSLLTRGGPGATVAKRNGGPNWTSIVAP